jgi:hypothetical protein
VDVSHLSPLAEVPVEIDRVETFLPYFEKVRERTLRVAERIPRERLEWSGVCGPPLYGLTSEEVRERSVAMT